MHFLLSQNTDISQNEDSCVCLNNLLYTGSVIASPGLERFICNNLLCHLLEKGYNLLVHTNLTLFLECCMFFCILFVIH